MFITHRPTLTLQLHNFDLFRTCRTSSFCTVAWQLARFQLKRRIARSLGDSWASCRNYFTQHWSEWKNAAVQWEMSAARFLVRATYSHAEVHTATCIWSARRWKKAPINKLHELSADFWRAERRRRVWTWLAQRTRHAYRWSVSAIRRMPLVCCIYISGHLLPGSAVGLG